MSITEIEKLREKVEKDPNSRLYVPLAEEYRKEGMLDEAIDVLQKGLERHPGYMSARVSLGKIYHAKGLVAEARAEFESVIKSIPDNLYAHKKLAEIYKDTGEKDLAVKAFRMVLKLNPMDEETINSLRDLEGGSSGQSMEKLQEAAPPNEDDSSETLILDRTTHENPEIEELEIENPKVQESTEPTEDMDAFKESLFGLKTEASEESMEEMTGVEEGLSLEPVEIPEESDEEWSFGVEETAAGTGPVEEEVSVDTVEIPEEADEEWSFGDKETAAGTEPVEEEVSVDTVEIPQEADEGLPFGDMADIAVTEDTKPAEKSVRAVSGKRKDKGELLQEADTFISEGKYFGAINAYKQILAADTGDKQTLQRLDELRSLLKLMGKDKEVLISKLNDFLTAINKRGDEFHRSS